MSIDIHLEILVYGTPEQLSKVTKTFGSQRSLNRETFIESLNLPSEIKPLWKGSDSWAARSLDSVLSPTYFHLELKEELPTQINLSGFSNSGPPFNVLKWISFSSQVTIECCYWVEEQVCGFFSYERGEGQFHNTYDAERHLAGLLDSFGEDGLLRYSRFPKNKTELEEFRRDLQESINSLNGLLKRNMLEMPDLSQLMMKNIYLVLKGNARNAKNPSYNNLVNIGGNPS